jgi:glyoxylase-like metal-dependent hydrolase (beta-lactamase superfamily II)
MYATRLSDRALAITGDYAEEHMTVLATGEGLIVVDTLGTLAATRAALPLVEQFSREPVRYLVNTHLDADHAAGNAAFAGAAILAHANGTKHLVVATCTGRSVERAFARPDRGHPDLGFGIAEKHTE